MTIRQFQQQAESLGETGDYISCTASMSHGQLSFVIWSGKEANHYCGGTPEEALAGFECRNNHIVEPLPDIELGDVEAPPENLIQEVHEELNEGFFNTDHEDFPL